MAAAKKFGEWDGKERARMRASDEAGERSEANIPLGKRAPASNNFSRKRIGSDFRDKREPLWLNVRENLDRGRLHETLCNTLLSKV